LKVKDFLFLDNKNVVSVLGESIYERNALLFQILKEMKRGIYFSFYNNYFIYKFLNKNYNLNIYLAKFNTPINLIDGVAISIIKYRPRIIIIDSINKLYLLSKNYIDISLPLVTIRSFSKTVKFLLVWEGNPMYLLYNKLLRYFSDGIFVIRKNYIESNGRICKFKVISGGVLGCI
jgi:hypothetical protein